MAALVLFPGCVSVCNLLPSAVWPNPAFLPGSFAFLLASSFLPTEFTARRCLSVGQKERVLWTISGLSITSSVCMKCRLMRVGGERWTGHCAGYSAWRSSHNIQLWSSIQKWKSLKKWSFCYKEDLVCFVVCFFFYPRWNLGMGRIIQKTMKGIENLVFQGRKFALPWQ